MRATLAAVLCFSIAGLAASPNVESAVPNSTPEKPRDPQQVEEIIVTGTHIRGVQFSASPILKFDRADIARSGYSTVDQFVESLSQNFGAGASQDNVGTDSSVGNNGYGAAVNLRALGPGASLVLLNGRRLAPGGNSGRFIDISMIPLSAVERIEVLTDGASAIYGSDAVGGVVNFILRDDYEGAETSVRYGGVSDGDLREIQASQSLGANWSGGGTLLAYEYHHRDALDARDRDFASASGLPRTLLPEQKRHSVYANIHQDLSERWSLFGDVLYSRRDSANELSYLSLHNEEKSENEQLFASMGAQIDIDGNWSAEATASYSEYQFEASLLRTPEGETVGELTQTNVDTDVWSFDVLTDGSLVSLPGGDLRLALGASYRSENVLPIGGNVIPERTVKAAFGELFIPLFGASNRRPGVEALELSVAARYEDYNDFGEDVTPKIGLRWQQIGGLSLRGTYGESFKAPTVTDLAPGTEALLAFIASDFGLAIDGDPLILLRTQAARPDLHEEESSSWTVGIDFQPEGTAFSLGLTYFSIEFEGRIDSPTAGGFDEFFVSPDVFGQFLVADPSAAFVDARLADATEFTDLTGGAFTPATVDLWADVSVTNIAAEEQSGVDLTLTYAFETSRGRFDASLNGTYIDTLEKKFAPAAPPREVLNLLNEPIDLRLRGGLVWSVTDLSAALFVNYQDSYGDAEAPIASWTTVDAQLRYAFASQSAAAVLENVSLTLSAQNLLNKDPPFVLSQGSPIAHSGYDSVNATPLGRFLALQVAKTW
jgi:iron complex outermembrane receptor protein